MVTKKQLIKQTSKLNNLTFDQNALVVDSFLQALSTNITANKSIKIRNFGTFLVSVLPPRRHIGLGKIHKLGKTRKIKLKIAPALTKIDE